LKDAALLLLDTGLRVGELIRLEKADVQMLSAGARATLGLPKDFVLHSLRHTFLSGWVKPGLTLSR